MSAVTVEVTRTASNFSLLSEVAVGQKIAIFLHLPPFFFQYCYTKFLASVGKDEEKLRARNSRNTRTRCRTALPARD